MTRKLTSTEERVVGTLRNGSPMKYADLRKLAGGNRAIKSLVDDGIVERLSMGLYMVVAEGNDTSWETFAALSVRRPDAVVCFESAAAFHGLITANPNEVCAAFPVGTTPPKGDYNLVIRPSRWNEKSMTAGVDTVSIAGIDVKVTSPARTVVDMHRFSNSRGETEFAGEAMASYAAQYNLSEVARLARELGCEGSIRPKLTALQSVRMTR